MKKNFLTGLALLLPIVLTLIIIMFFVNLLTRPFLGIVHELFEKTGVLNLSFSYFSIAQAELFVSRVLILITLTLFTFFIGFLARHFFLDYIFKATDKLIHRIPIVNKIYKAFQEVMQTIFSPQRTTFSQVVLAPYPHEATLAVGFVTKENLPEGSDRAHVDLISVFIPGTPNPMMGFNLLYREDQLVFLDMKVDDALKCIISCGVMCNDFNPMQKTQPQDISGD